MDSKNKKLIFNTVIFFVGSIGSKFIQFFLVPLYTYSLNTAQYGVTEIVMTASNVLMPVFSISISDGLLRYGLDKDYKKDSVLKTALSILAIGTIISIVGIPVYLLYDGLKNWIFYFLLITNLRIYRDFLAINLKINEKNIYFTIDSMVYTFSLCGFSIVFLTVLKLGIPGYFLAFVFANIISIIFLIIVGRPIKTLQTAEIDKKLRKELFLYSLPMIVNGIAWWVITASDKFIIKGYLGEAKVGLYAVAAKLPTLISVFSGVFLQAWIISAVTEYDSEAKTKFYSQVFEKYYCLLALAAAGLVAIIYPFMKIYVSKEFFSAWIFAPLLITGAVYSGIFGFFVGIYAAAKNSINVTITTAIGALVNIVLNCFLIPRIGVMGAVIATYISWLTGSIIRIIDTRKIMKLNINYRLLLTLMILGLFQCICVISQDYKIGFIISSLVVLCMLFSARKPLLSIVQPLINKISKRMHHEQRNQKENT